MKRIVTTKYDVRSKLERVFKHDLLLALVIGITIIFVGAGLGYENNKVVLVNPLPLTHYMSKNPGGLSFLANWDGANYLAIASHGYVSANQTNFFPLYPMLIYLFHFILFSPLYSALIISWVSLVGAVFFYIKISGRLFNVKGASEKLRAALVFILFPPAIWLLAAYTESLFAFLALGAIYFSLSKRYLLAGLMLMLANAAHVDGVFVLALVAMIMIEERAGWWRILATGVTGFLGLAGYMLYLSARYRNPLSFVTAQRQHGWLEHSLGSLAGDFSFVHLLFLLLLIAGAIYWWKKRKSFSIYCLLFVLVPLVGGQFGGFERYCLMAFPVPLMLYSFFRQKTTAYSIIIAISAIFWTYFLFQFSGGYIGG